MDTFAALALATDPASESLLDRKPDKKTAPLFSVEVYKQILFQSTLFLSGIKSIAAISLALKYPTIVSVSHSLVNSYKNLLAITLATEYTFEGAEKVIVVLSVSKTMNKLLHTENTEHLKDAC